MTATDRDPATIAREVLDMAHEDDTITVCTIPDNKAAALARAVIRMEALGEMLERESSTLRDREDCPNESSTTAACIRAVLNGGAR